MILKNGNKALDKQTLSVMESKLLLLRRELLSGVTKTHEHSNDEFDGEVVDLSDEATRTYSRQVSLSVGEVEREQIKLIDEALEQIKTQDSDYGICIDCEEDIPVERLKVAPYVKRCIDCEEEWEAKLQLEQ